jgi:hypothetical protein
VVAVEVGSALFELGEILHRSQGSLRAVNLLVEHASQTGGIQPETCSLRAQVRGQVKSGVRIEVLMAVKTSNAKALLGNFAIFCLIELFLREWCE